MEGHSEIDLRDLLRLFRALSDETRLRMLKLLMQRELCVCEIMQALDVSQSRASRNLGLLEDAGILRSRRVGAWVHYALDDAWASGRGQEVLAVLQQSANADPAVRQDAERLAKAVRAESRACLADGGVARAQEEEGRHSDRASAEAASAI